MNYDAVVLGAGPAGYVCAIRLAQLGMKTAIVEGRDLGGVCLNVGCIPSKALIAASRFVKKSREAHKMGIDVGEPKVDLVKMIGWKDSIVQQLTGGVKVLLEKNGVTIVRGFGKVATPHKVEVQGPEAQVLETKNIVVATGSRPIEIPGFAFDGKHVWSSTHALAPKQFPKRLLVIGGGVIGLELGLVYHALGAELRVVEFMDRVLPGLDGELSKEMGRSLKKKKIPVHLGAKAMGYSEKDGALSVQVDVGDGKVEEFVCDAILSSVGRAPNGHGLGLEEVGVEVSDRGFVSVDLRQRTNVPSIYAIGDITGQPMLAHKGSAEGLVAAASIAGDAGAAFDPVGIPGVVFTDPEIATVGLTEEEAKEQGFEIGVGKFPFRASGRALSLMEPEGWVKIITDKQTDKVLGVHMIGPEVTELIGEGTLALEAGLTAEDIAMTIHAHPTLPEAIMEAAENVHKMAVHILN
ncbi:MAG TPA: dihydrolipoyl dehydrogenase [Planctomycetes bacterium]|nr:dihydrolipoyl dehydrogenase [Planctomycetota bacterium]